MSERPGEIVRPEPWAALRSLTPARIAIGRAGASLPTEEVLRFGLDHARARDAVHAALDAKALAAELGAAGHAVRCVHSAAPDRPTYLARPDLGRKLDPESAAGIATSWAAPSPLVVVAADGLSALAIERHLPPLLRELGASEEAWSSCPVVVALQARVALGDEIGERMGAEVVVVAIGERPGLSSPDSLGLYVTLAPRRGRTDAERNCISNIRPEGLPYSPAAKRLIGTVAAARERGYTGVAGKRPPVLPGPSPAR